MVTRHIHSLITVNKTTQQKYENKLEAELHPSEAVLWSGTADFPHLIYRIVFGVFIFVPLFNIVILLLSTLIGDRGFPGFEILAMAGMSMGALSVYLLCAPFLIASEPVFITDRRVLCWVENENVSRAFILDITAATTMTYRRGSNYILIKNPGKVFDLERFVGEARQFNLGPYQDAKSIANILEKIIASKRETPMQKSIKDQSE